MTTTEKTATKDQWITRLKMLNDLVPSDWPDAVVSAAIENQVALERVRDTVSRAEAQFINKYAARDEQDAVLRADTPSEATINLGQGEKPYVVLKEADAFYRARQAMLQEETTVEVRVVSRHALSGYTLGDLRPLRWMLESGVDVPHVNSAVEATA